MDGISNTAIKCVAPRISAAQSGCPFDFLALCACLCVSGSAWCCKSVCDKVNMFILFSCQVCVFMQWKRKRAFKEEREQGSLALKLQCDKHTHTHPDSASTRVKALQPAVCQGSSATLCREAVNSCCYLPYWPIHLMLTLKRNMTDRCWQHVAVRSGR